MDSWSRHYLMKSDQGTAKHLPCCPIKQKGRQQVAVQLIDVVLIDVKNYIVLHVHPSSKFVDIYSGLEQSLIPLI